MIKTLRPLTIALMCGIVFSAGCGKTNIDLNKYVTVEVSGYDGYGEADVDFDLDALRADYDDKLKYKGCKHCQLSYGICEQNHQLLLGEQKHEQRHASSFHQNFRIHRCA